MRIAICLFKYYPYGGLERDFMKIALECYRRQHAVDVYTMFWDADLPSEFQVIQIPVRGVSNHARIESYTRSLSVYLKKQAYDLILGFNQMPELDVYFAADICYQASAVKKHYAWYRLTPRYRAYVARERAVYAADKQTQILLLVESQKKQFMHYYQTAEERFHFIPPGIDKTRLLTPDVKKSKKEIRFALNLPQDKFMLLMVGSGFKVKGVDRSLYALAALPPALKVKTNLYIIGKRKCNFLLRLVKKLKLTEQVKFLGGRFDVGSFMQAADLLIHPAYEETAGMVLLEALVSGLPVLVTANCGYAFHVERAKAGRLIPMPFEQETLNQYLREMLSGNQRIEWRMNGIRYAESTDLYSLPGHVVDLLEKFHREKSHVA